MKWRASPFFIPMTLTTKVHVDYLAAANHVIKMDDAIDLSMSFDNDDDDRPSSPHNTRETAIVIDDSDDDFDMAQKMPAASAASMPSWSSTTTAAAYNSAENSNSATAAAGSASAQAVGSAAAPTSPPNRTCASCGKEGNNLKKCSACRSVHYCNATCQYSHWSEHRDECHKNRTAVKREQQQQQYATSTSARVSMSPTMNDPLNHVPPAVAAAISAGMSAAAVSNRSKKYSCSLCPQKFMTQNQRRKHEKKCRKRHLKKLKAERANGRGGVGKVKAEKPKAKEKEEGEEDVEEADEITYTSYKPQKLKFGMDHPDPVVENSTLSAVEPPEVEYNLAMPADILSVGKLSNLQLEAIVYGCQRHLIDLPLKEGVVFDGGEVVVEKPVRAGFLLGDGAGMGKGRTLAGFVIENLARGRNRHVWISVSSDLYEDAKRDLRDLGLGDYADTHCYNLGKLPYGDLAKSHPEGVMFATYSTLISKNRQKQTRLDQLIDWCGGEDFDGLVMFDECHKAKTIELDANGNPKTVGRGSEKREKSSQTAKNVVHLQQALPRARVVYCSATSVSHPKNLGFMSRLGLWGPGTEHPSGFNQFLDGLKRLGTGAMELHAMHLKSIGALCARTLSYESCEFELVDGISDEKVSAMYNKASEIWTALHSQLLDRCSKIKKRDDNYEKIAKWSEEMEITAEMCYHLELHRDSDSESDHDDDDKLVEERRLRRTYRERKAKNLLGLFWSAHQRFFRSLCIASKVDTAISLAKKALADGNCCVIGLQSTGEARSKGAAAAAGINEDSGGSFEDFVSAPNEDLKRIIMMMFPLPPKPRGVIAPVFLNVNKSKDDDDVMEDSTAPSGQRFELGKVILKEFEDPSTGKMRMYEGTIKKYFDDEQLYNVEFEDGDSEDMTEAEVTMCVEDEESGKATFSGRSSRSARRKKVNYSEVNVDKDGNTGGSKGKKRKPSKKGRKSANKKRRGANNSISMVNSDDESESDFEYEAEQDEDDDTIDADDDAFDTTVSGKQPARGKSKKGKGKGSIKRIQWDEIDLSLDTSASVENERMVEYRKACEKVKGWLDDVDDLALPANPLDRLLNELGGPDKVAELTGRKIRQVRRFDESKGKMVVFYEKRKGAGRFDQINVEERNNFQSGKKLVAILSEAASTGISLQADKRVGNQKRRVHITLELPWSADKAIQQLGRTHRANQTSGPSYKFLISDVGGEKRFAAAVAKRLALMGALTQGDRRATGQSNALGLGGFDFDNKFGKLALKTMLEEIWECNKNCLTDAPEKLVLDALKTIDSRLSEALDQGIGTWKKNLAPYSDDSKSEQDHYKMMEALLLRKCPQLAAQRVKAIGEGRSVVKYLEKLLDGTETKEAIKPKIDEEVKAAMEAGLNFNVLCFLWLFDVGVTEQSASGANNYFKKGKPIDVPKFLNRTLGMNLLRQKLIVEHFIKHLGKQVTLAKRAGTYDLGIQTIGGHSVVIEKPRSFCFRGLEAKDERVLLYKVNLDRGMDAETASQLYKEAEASSDNETNSSANNIGAGGFFGVGQVRVIKSGFYIDRRDVFKEVPRMFLIINQGRTSNNCVVVRPNEGKKIWTKEFVWKTWLHGNACQLTLCTDVNQAMVTWKKEFDLADRPSSERYQRYCYGRHTESCVFGGDIIPILNKILASSNLNGIGLANEMSLVMPDVVRVEPPGKTPEDDSANEVTESTVDAGAEDEDDSSEPPAVGHKVALKMLGGSVFRGAITECKDDPESFITTFTDGSVVEMSADEVNKARQLFDTEWTKLVVDADVPKAVASSIEVHNSVNAQAQGATRRPILPAGEEKTTEEYEKIFEEEYDGDVPNVLVGLEFPKKDLRLYSQSAHDHVFIPFWQFVLRKLAERLLEEGAHSSRELLNLENAESVKLQQG